MIAKCIKVDDKVDLTLDKVYEVVSFDNFFGMVRIIGDGGELYWYSPVYFEVWE